MLRQKEHMSHNGEAIKIGQALKLLAANSNKTYKAAIEVTRGDILVSVNRKADALQAYQAACEAFPGLEIVQPLLQMKMDDLADCSVTAAGGAKQ